MDIGHSPFPVRHPIFFFFLLLTATAGDAMAGAWDFVPRYMDYSGELVLKGMMDGRETTTENRSSSYQDINFQEFLHVNGVGFMYSPSFISLLSDISIGLQQESREADDLTYRQDNSMFGFRQELIVLPDHPYNLHLYAGRTEELVRGRAGGSSRAVVYEWGARARYQKRPWQTMLNYTHFETASTWDSVTDTIGANLYYFDTLTFWNINGSYNHYLSSRYNDQNNTVKDVFAAHISKKWESFRFLSRWDLDQHTQEDHYQSILNLPDYSETRNRWEWFNELAADLPFNVTSRFSYRKRNSDAEFQRGTETGGAISDTDSYNLNFTHHLYKSLITNLNSGYRTTESLGGKTEQKDLFLSTNYSKIIRWGTIGASLSGGISDTGNVGGTTILSEKHSLTPSSPTSFTLNSTQLDPDTIRVSVIDSFNNNMIVPLARDIHYTVVTVGESYRILILSLPLSLTEPWTDYIYIADYANISSDFTIRGTNWGGTLKFSLYNQLITPHAGYRQSEQQTIDGSFPGILDNSKSYDVGLSTSYGNVQGDISKYWRTSTTENEERLIVYITSSLKITRLTGGSCALSYENNNIEQLFSTSSNRKPALEEDIYSTHFQVFTAWPEWHLDGTLGVNYSLYQGLGESTTRSINSALTWRIGRMDINMRLAYHDSESEVQTSFTSSDYYTAWITVRRQLF
jgi:hypothetical protein